jgi:hypothetical protein
MTDPKNSFLYLVLLISLSLWYPLVIKTHPSFTTFCLGQPSVNLRPIPAFLPLSTMAGSTSSSSSTTAAEGGHNMDNEGKPQPQEKASHWELVYDQTHVTPEVLNWQYKGSGTEEDPYVVEYIENDRRNPMLFPDWKKWTITILVAIVSSSNLETLVVFSYQSALNPSDQAAFRNDLWRSNYTNRQPLQSLLFLLHIQGA